MRCSTLCVSLALVTFAACADAVEKTEAPRHDGLAAAKADGQAVVGALSFTKPSDGTLSRAVAQQTWTLDVRAGSLIDLEVTHGGTTAALDTVMIVVGPVTSDEATTPLAAEDDDSGWGLHSRIRGLRMTGSGTVRYLVTVQSYDGKQKGKYRLVTTCREGKCEPDVGTPVDDRYCHPALSQAIERCIDGQLADIDRDPATWTALDIGRACVDAEPIAPTRDSICETERPSPSWCALDFEAFMNAQVGLCEDSAVDYAMAQECVFGAGFRDLREGLANVTVTHRRLITDNSTLTTLEGQQLVAAVQVAYEEADDVASALEAVDGGEVNQLHVWDATRHLGFVAYEYGAGDNSYGGIVAEGGATVVVAIHDGDYQGCPLPGPELKTCAGDTDCGSGLRCTGLNRESRVPLGRCVAPHEFVGESQSCTTTPESNGCPIASGLVCGGVDAAGDGMCMPAWQRGSFEDYAVAHIPARGKLVRTLTAYGLTTVSTDVAARVVADFPTPTDLLITLTNPATTIGVVWANEAGDLDLQRAIRAFPGDESANGDWVLTIENRGASSGTLVSWGLDIMSRWD